MLTEYYRSTIGVQIECKKNPSSQLPRRTVSEKTDMHQQKKPQEQSRGFHLFLNHKLRNCELAVINAVVNYRFDVFDLVAPLAPLLSLTTFAAGALTGCRNAACAAASRAIGTRNGLQLT